MTLGIEKLRRLVGGSFRDEAPPVSMSLLSDAERAERDRIREYCQKMEIRSLYHFTPSQNLESILKFGLMPREELDRGGFSYEKTDQNRMDGALGALSLSISFPNYRMFYKKREDYKNWRWAVMEIAPDVLWEKDCRFLQTNAASRQSVDRRGENRKLEELRNLFLEIHPKGFSREKLQIPAFYPTDPQAEILAYGKIEPSFFKCVHVEKKRVLEEIKKHKGNQKVRLECSPFLFRARQDYSYWKDVVD